MNYLTDAEQRFADSLEGKAAIAVARYKHGLRVGYQGSDAPPFTDAMERETVRAAKAAADRPRTELGDEQKGQTVVLKHLRDEAIRERDQSFRR